MGTVIVARGLLAGGVVSAILLGACGDGPSPDPERSAVRPPASAEAGGQTVPANLQLISADPKSRQIVLRVTLSPCEKLNGISVTETDQAVRIAGSATVMQRGSVMINDRPDLNTDGLTACEALGDAHRRVVRVRRPVGSRRILLNGATATPIGEH
jgi:hypothetical protein